MTLNLPVSWFSPLQPSEENIQCDHRHEDKCAVCKAFAEAVQTAVRAAPHLSKGANLRI